MSDDFSTKMQDRLWQEVDDLKAKLAQAEKERDEALASYDKEQRINARYMAEHVRVEKERDAAQAEAAHRWAELRQCVENDTMGLIANLVKNVDRLTGERDQYIGRCNDLQTVQLRLVEELAKVEGEARVARQAAARYKRRAYLLYCTWCGYWGTPVDWGFLRTALYDPKEAGDD